MSNPARIALLHIGGEKTGTTTLQATLAANRTALAGAGMMYSRAAGREAHGLLALYASAGEGTADLRAAMGLDPPGHFENFLARFPAMLAREAAESGARVLIYSSEHLSSRLHDQSAVERVRTLLAKLVDEVHLVYYARPQAELVLAAWSTMLKSGSAAPFSLAAALSNPTMFDHAALVTRWAEAFPGSPWRFRPYQSALLTDNDIVADFCACTGVAPGLLRRRVTRLNRSLDTPRAEFLRLWNGLPRAMERPRRGQMIRVLESLSEGPPLGLDPAEVATLESRYGAGNAALARHFLGRERLFADLAPPLPPAGPLLSAEQAVAIAASLWDFPRTEAGAG
jgi:hypothetical protein